MIDGLTIMNERGIMEINVRKSLIFLIIMVVVIAFSAIMADQIEGGFGKVEVSIVEIEDPDGNIVVAKLYRPKEATASNPMPRIAFRMSGST